MATKQAAHRMIIYYPPPAQVIDEFARAVCLQMAQTVDAEFGKPEIIRGFASFITVVATIYAKHLSTHLDATGKLDI